MVDDRLSWKMGLVWAGAVCLLLLAGPVQTGAEVIYDDPFDGDSLDSGTWNWVSNNPEWEPVVSEGRLILSAGKDDWLDVSPFGAGGNYTAPTLYDVRVEGVGQDFRFDFGYGVGLLGGWAYLWTDASDLWVGYTHPGGESCADLGPWVDGADYGIDWTPSFFRIYRDGELLYSEDDPDRVPYYEYFGFAMEVQDGTVSLDRVVVLTPEPGTLTLLTAGAVLCLHRRGRG